jgi:sarcosine oxidase
VSGPAFQAIVVGLGAMGSAALAHLAARGVRALGIEAHPIGHALGSSHGASRVIRKAYFEDPRYVPMLHRAYQLWHALEQESGETLLLRTGCLNIGGRDHVCIRGVVESARRHGLAHEVLDAAEVSRRFPAFRLGQGEIAVFENDGGILPPERCVKAHVTRALARGATVVEERALRVELDRDGVLVETDRGRYSADMLVLTQGPWMTRALVPMPAPLAVERQVQCWFTPREPALFDTDRFPVFIHFLPDRAYYGLPPFGIDGVKVCRHHGGAPADPDALDRVVHPADEEDVRRYLRDHLPAADGPLLHAAVCMYTNTPDDHFAIGLHPDHPRVVLAGGFSGHGFKLAPVVGEIVADLVTRGRTEHEIAFFDPMRFAR